MLSWIGAHYLQLTTLTNVGHSLFVLFFFFFFDSQNVKAHVKVPKENDGEEVSCLHHPHSLKNMQ